ncbi:MAG: radical SAM protein [Polyangiales bacterium]
MNHATPGMQTVLAKLAGRAIEARLRADGRPFVVGLFITHHCMCACESCLWKHNDWKDVPTDDLKRLFREAKEQGFVAAAITGGEPFLRRDLGEIVRYVKEDLDMSILLITTGWYLKQRMDEVLPWIDMLMLSMDSARPERHDAIRKLPGLHARLIEGIGLVRERYPALSVQLNTCVQRGLERDGEVDALLALSEELGVPISFDVITERRNGEEGSAFTLTSMGLPPAEVQRVCLHLLERKRAGARIMNSERYFEYFANGRRGYRCHLPKLAMMVDGRGLVEDCLDLDHPLGDIRTTPLAEIMASERFRQLRCDAEQCSSCSSPTMVDLSHIWEDPSLVLRPGGLAVG